MSAGAPPEPPDVSRQPDILIIVADQLTPGALPFHGDPVTQAPAMAELAEHGVVFDAAYCPSPLCAPSRAALMTGLLPSRTGVYDNAAALASDVPTFAHYLRREGYQTALAGKMHFCGPDQLHGFERRLTTDIYPADFGWTPDWSRPDERPHWYHDMSSVIDAGPCVRSNQLDYDEEAFHAAEQLLYDHARSADDRPLCLVASFTHPHDPYTITHQWWDRYDGADIPLPTHPYDDAVATPHERRLRQVCATDVSQITPEQVRAALRAYRGEISYVDNHIARLLDVLRSTGRLDDTVVVLTSDHGDMLGERGLWYKMSFFEGSARVPFIVCAPGRFAPARVATPVSTADLLPTLLSIVSDGDGPDPVGPLDGRDLHPMLTGQSLDRDPVRAEYLAEGAIAPIVMTRSGDLKLVRSPADPDQLYDLAADPAERHNLVGDPAYAERYGELQADMSSYWDLTEIDRRVHESQRQRRVIDQALASGAHEAWDYSPGYDGSRRFIRNHRDLGESESLARFPRVT
jgi:choline-sulfatase